jgi:hypothetical protein
MTKGSKYLPGVVSGAITILIMISGNQLFGLDLFLSGFLGVAVGILSGLLIAKRQRGGPPVSSQSRSEDS